MSAIAERPVAQPLTRYPRERQFAEDAAHKNAVAIQQAHPWLAELDAEIEALLQHQAAPKVVLRRFRQLADRVAAAVGPHAACHRGCAACCHISVVLSDQEARLIGQEIGRAPRKVVGHQPEDRDALVADYFGTPCTFLVAGQCSIYASRPLACRLHFNIGGSAFFCDTAISPDESCVPNLNFQAFWLGLTLGLSTETFADIREMFPSLAVARPPPA